MTAGSDRGAWGSRLGFLPGAPGEVAGVGILSFSSVIAGWTIAYIWFTGTGAVHGSPEAIGAFFREFTANGPASILLPLTVLGVTAASIIRGVRKGMRR